MEYNRIIAVTGIPGLFELVSSKTDGAIVRSLEDQNTRFVSSRVHNFSHLESIEVYTSRENVNLVEVFKAIESAGKALPSDKDAAAVKQFFKDVYPTLDFERVYSSDMKKMVKWFAIIKNANIPFTLNEVNEEPELAEITAAVTETPVEAEKPVKKVKTKKTETVVEEGEKNAEAKPVKATRKKKTEE
jgi:antitoxin component of RelBE/YafQ-DinJ toxin-antitoxin module